MLFEKERQGNTRANGTNVNMLEKPKCGLHSNVFLSHMFNLKLAEALVCVCVCVLVNTAL